MIGLFVLVLFACDLLIPLGFAVGLGYIIPVVLSFRYRDERITKAIAALGVVLTIAGWALSPAGGITWMVLANRIFSIFAIVLCAGLGVLAQRERSSRARISNQHAEAERARQAVERLFHAITSVLIEVDAKRIVQRWNHAAELTFALPQSAVLGRDLTECGIAWHDADREDLARDLDKGITAHGLELRFDDSEGQQHSLGASLSHLPATDSNPESTLILARDITSDARQRQNQKRLITAVEQVDETIVITDLSGEIIYVNPAFTRVTGYTASEALGLDPSILRSGKHTPEFYEDMWKTLERGDVWTGHFTNRRKDGRLFEEDATISPVRDESGQITNFVAVKRDVTERLAMETQLRTAQKLESIGQLAAGIAHEINTPAQFISDNTCFLKESFASIAPLLELSKSLTEESCSSQQRASVLEQLANSARSAKIDFLIEEIPAAIDESLEGLSRVTEIVSAMKSFSHPGVKEMQPVDLNEIIKTTITLSTNEWKYVAKIETDLDPKLPQVDGLPGELGQVVLNMIVNGAHAIAESSDGDLGTITIKTSTDEASGTALIAISDTGCGIPDSKLERVFDQFYTTKEVGKGTGQGLALSHSVVVDNHAGHISLTSEVGVGTTFTIHLPITAKSHENDDATPCA